MKKLLLLLIIFCITLNVNAQTKRALIVAIGDYPTKETGWINISSINDYKIIYQMLLNQEFKKENIDSLLNEDATAAGLDQKFSELLSKCEKGDMIYFHFSGHGQQVTDTDQENSISDYEDDGYDESLVMFSAPSICEEGYDMSEHYIDDKLNYWITEIRKQIVDGHVIMVLDACHSGTGSRGIGENSNVVRGTKAICGRNKNKYKKKETSKGFGLEFSKSENIGDLVVFSGCKAEEVNAEYWINGTDPDKRFGSLSYAFVQGVGKLSKSDATYYDLYGSINEFVETSINQKFNINQHPQIEPEEGKNLKIFAGDFIPADLTYNIQAYKNEEVAIDAGSINSNIKIGDKVEFRLVGVKDGIKIIGEATKVEMFSSVVYAPQIEQDDILTGNQYHNFKDMFECTLPYSFKLVETKLEINVDVKSSKDKSKIQKFLKDNPLFEYNQNANYTITDSSSLFVVKVNSTGMVVQNMKVSDYKSEDFISVLNDLSAIESARNNHFDSPEIEINFSFGKNCNEYTLGDKVDVIFENTGNKSAYVYIYEITPIREIKLFLPETFIKKSDSVSEYQMVFDELCGNYTYLVISSDQPLNLKNLNKLVQNSKSRDLNKEPQVDWKKSVYTVVEKIE